MHPFVKENREGYKRNRKNPPYHTAHLSNATKRLAWLFFNSQTFCVKRHPKEEEKKRASDFWARKKTVIWWFSFSRKKQQFFGGQHKCFYKECSVAEATQYDKSPWWVEMRVISLKKKENLLNDTVAIQLKIHVIKCLIFILYPEPCNLGWIKKLVSNRLSNIYCPPVGAIIEFFVPFWYLSIIKHTKSFAILQLFKWIQWKNIYLMWHFLTIWDK